MTGVQRSVTLDYKVDDVVRGGEDVTTLASFLEELFVEEEDEQVDIDFCLVEHLHHCHTLILELQQVLFSQTHTYYSSITRLDYLIFLITWFWFYLVFQQELLHFDTQKSGFDVETSGLRSRNNVQDDVFKPGTVHISPCLFVVVHIEDLNAVRSHCVVGRSSISKRTPFSCSRAAL